MSVGGNAVLAAYVIRKVLNSLKAGQWSRRENEITGRENDVSGCREVGILHSGDGSVAR